MDLRLCFEPEGRMTIDDPKAFEQYVSHYLADFNAEFAGYIAMNEAEKKQSNLQPVWQFLVKDLSSDQEQALLDYLDRNPINSYHTHVYKMHGPGHETKVH